MPDSKGVWRKKEMRDVRDGLRTRRGRIGMRAGGVFIKLLTVDVRPPAPREISP